MTLEEIEALRKDLSADLDPSAPIALMEQRFDSGDMNGFLESFRELLPVGTWSRFLNADEPVLLRAARSGRALNPQKISAVRTKIEGAAARALVAQSADDVKEPSISIGYAAVKENDYRLEVRVQHPTVTTVLLTQEIERRAPGEVRVAEYRDLRAHGKGPHVPTPAGGSLSIGESVGHKKCQAGTLGLFMRSRDGVGILSNSHILAWCGRAKVGDPIYAPHPNDSNNPVKIGQLKLFSSLINDDVVRFDAAFATLDGETSHNGNLIPTKMPNAGKKILVAGKMPTPGVLKVAKIGRTSRHTVGTFSAAGIDATLEYPGLGAVKLTGMLEILWDTPEKAFSEPGDSGSVVYGSDTREAIAIVVGGGVRLVDGKPEGVSIACPLEPVIAEWGLSPI